MIKSVVTIACVFVLSGCAATHNSEKMDASLQVADNALIPSETGSEDEPTDSLADSDFPPLNHIWNTSYSAYLTAPPEVRDAARAACEARRFDMAVMSSLSLDADEAEANFTCRGPND